MSLSHEELVIQRTIKLDCVLQAQLNTEESSLLGKRADELTLAWRLHGPHARVPHHVLTMLVFGGLVLGQTLCHSCNGGEGERTAPPLASCLGRHVH